MLTPRINCFEETSKRNDKTFHGHTERGLRLQNERYMIDAEAYKVFYFKNCIYFTSKFGLNARTCRTAQRIILWVGTLLGRENPVTKSVESFSLVETTIKMFLSVKNFLVGKKSLIELGRNVFTRSNLVETFFLSENLLFGKIFRPNLVEKFFSRSNMVKMFFIGRPWSKCFSSIETGQTVLPRSNINSLSRDVRNIQFFWSSRSKHKLQTSIREGFLLILSGLPPAAKSRAVLAFEESDYSLISGSFI